MSHQDRLAVLNRFFDLHDRFTRNLDVACHRGCHTCCTRNLTITTLEGAAIRVHLEDTGRLHLLAAVRQAASGTRFVPRLTINTLAALCARGEEVPEEYPAPQSYKCPLLIDGVCAVYPSRPLGCRNLLSVTRCPPSGSARIDPLTMSVNSLFLQFVEHLDHAGFTGNLADILLYWENRRNRGAFRNTGTAGPTEHLVMNRAVPALMVPPEHRRAVAPWIAALQRAAFIDKV